MLVRKPSQMEHSNLAPPLDATATSTCTPERLEMHSCGMSVTPSRMTAMSCRPLTAPACYFSKMSTTLSQIFSAIYMVIPTPCASKKISSICFLTELFRQDLCPFTLGNSLLWKIRYPNKHLLETAHLHFQLVNLIQQLFPDFQK